MSQAPQEDWKARLEADLTFLVTSLTSGPSFAFTIWLMASKIAPESPKKAALQLLEVVLKKPAVKLRETMVAKYTQASEAKIAALRASPLNAFFLKKEDFENLERETGAGVSFILEKFNADVGHLEKMCVELFNALDDGSLWKDLC